MLVLSRRVNESIVVGRDVRITISRIQGNRVRLAIEAPRETPVCRAEVAARNPTTAGCEPDGMVVVMDH